MKRILLVFAVMCLAASESRAVPLTLISDFPVGTPLTFLAPAAGTSGPMTFGITNTTAVDAPADLLTGWNFVLDIVGVAGASGLQFNSPPPVGPTNPTANYIFALSGVPNNGIFASLSNGATTLTAGDFENQSPLQGSQVPLTGADLLVVDYFYPTGGTPGLFNIVAQPAAATVWSDNGAISSPRAFLNDPSMTPGSPFIIGQVLVLVPEPSSVCVWCGFLLCAGLNGRRRRRRDPS